MAALSGRQRNFKLSGTYLEPVFFLCLPYFSQSGLRGGAVILIKLDTQKRSSSVEWFAHHQTKAPHSDGKKSSFLNRMCEKVQRIQPDASSKSCSTGACLYHPNQGIWRGLGLLS
eukprot:1140150-Pelagomonas_calceolata.AAC.1